MSGGKPPPTVLPEWATQTLIVLWVLLLGGRWLATPFLMMADPETVHRVAVDWDQRYLLWGYLILVIITLAVLALRIARQASPPASPPPDSRT